MERVIQEYYANDARKLHQVVDKILHKYGGISGKDKDDFYSLANEVFAVSLKTFNPSKCNFDGFLYSNLAKKIITEIRDKNREKRSNTKVKRDDDGNVVIDENGKAVYEFLTDLSLDAPINRNGLEGTVTIEEIISDDFDIYEAVWGESKTIKYERYMDALPKKARIVAELIGRLYKASEIKELLHITDKQYSEAMYCITAPEYISILY